ncbi:MAG: glycosyltransferase family 4 protein [Proteobacteria bacterium]|nr:glycosyltransferase family 4 protein [Pseudomonadota bacterium]
MSEAAHTFAAPPAPRSIYVAFEVFPRPKGASSHIAAMVTALAENRGPVWLLCCGFADMPAWQREGDIVIHRFKVHHPNLLRRAKEFGDFVFGRLAGLKTPPGLCVFRDPWGGWPALSALPDTPAVFEVNGLPSWELDYAYPALRNNPVLRIKIEEIERHCLDSADAVATVSEVTRAALIGLGVDGGRISVVPNSASDVFFNAPNGPGPDYLRAGRWFGYVGSLHPWQGLDLLIKAWAAAAGDLPETRLLVVHNGRRKPLKVLKKQIRKLGLVDRVLLQSPLPPDALADVISRLEFTVAPLTETVRNTVQGCCPIKIVESMAAGTPVLASDLQVTRDLITHDLDGHLVPPGRSRPLALAIRQLSGDDSQRNRLAHRCRETARTRFTRRVMFDKLEAIFQSASSAPKRS